MLDAKRGANHWNRYALLQNPGIAQSMPNRLPMLSLRRSKVVDSNRLALYHRLFRVWLNNKSLHFHLHSLTITSLASVYVSNEILLV